MSETIKYGKVKKAIPQSDGTTKIETKSYHEKLSSVREEVQQSIKTSKTTFIKDIMQCFAVISDKETREVTVTVEADENHQPMRIVKTWTTLKEYYGKGR